MNSWTGRIFGTIFVVGVAVGSYELGNALDNPTPDPGLIAAVAFLFCLIVFMQILLLRRLDSRIDPEARERMAEAIDERFDLLGTRMERRFDALDRRTGMTDTDPGIGAMNRGRGDRR